MTDAGITTATMRAAVASGVGGPEILHVEDVPVPQIVSAHDVRIRLRAAALNPVDYKVRQSGGYGDNRIYGCDGAGTVESAGSAVSRFSRGDDVYFVNGGYGMSQGTYAQFVVLDERYVARKPASLDFEEAAAVPLVTITAWEALYDRAGVAAGQDVLIHAGAGGVGHVAVQLASLAGARVAATVSPSKATLARSLGATETIDYRSRDVGEAVRAWTDGRNADVVFDTVGGTTFFSSIALLAHFGTLVTCVERSWPNANASEAMQHNVRIAYTWMPAPQVYGLHAARLRQVEILERAAVSIDKGKLRVVVGAVYPLEEIVEAHRALESGAVTGKIALTIP